MRCLRANVYGTAGAFLLATSMAAAGQIRIEPCEKWSAVFGGLEATFHYTVAADAAMSGRLGWRLSAAGRTIARDEAAVDGTPGRPVVMAVPLQVPELAEGVVLEARLDIAFIAEGATRVAAEHHRPVWIFAPDSFAGRADWLERLKITLFDPEKKTANLFDEARIPFRNARNMAALDGLAEGLVVVGEETSFRDHRGLADTLVAVAASGVPVLCLAPADGSLLMPNEADSPGPSLRWISLRRSDVIAELDHRLDAVAWPPDGRLATTGLALRGDRGLAVLEATVAVPGTRVSGWPWLEVQYAGKGARLIVCGFGVVRHYEAGPTPRYLLARLFERLTEKNPRIQSLSPEED